MKWLTDYFIPSTNARIKGAYRMLVLDGDRSHLTPEFDKACIENNMILTNYNVKQL
jgi:hypothetical protein